MASPVSYNFEPNTIVWVITPAGVVCNSAILSGTVIQVRINVLAAVGSPSETTTIKYDIRIENENGTTEFEEVDVFATLNAATVEYFSRLGGGSPLI